MRLQTLPIKKERSRQNLRSGRASGCRGPGCVYGREVHRLRRCVCDHVHSAVVSVGSRKRYVSQRVSSGAWAGVTGRHPLNGTSTSQQCRHLLVPPASVRAWSAGHRARRCVCDSGCPTAVDASSRANCGRQHTHGRISRASEPGAPSAHAVVAEQATCPVAQATVLNAASPISATHTSQQLQPIR